MLLLSIVPIPTSPSDWMRSLSTGDPFAALATLNVNAASSVATLTGHLSLPLPLVWYNSKVAGWFAAPDSSLI